MSLIGPLAATAPLTTSRDENFDKDLGHASLAGGLLEKKESTGVQSLCAELSA